MRRLEFITIVPPLMINIIYERGNQMFFKNYKVWETELAGRKLTLETGKMCGLAGASIMAPLRRHQCAV